MSEYVCVRAQGVSEWVCVRAQGVSVCGCECVCVCEHRE